MLLKLTFNTDKKETTVGINNYYYYKIPVYFNSLEEVDHVLRKMSYDLVKSIQEDLKSP